MTKPGPANGSAMARKRFSRRAFLSAAAASGAYIAARRLHFFQPTAAQIVHRSAGDKLNLAAIGIGGQGNADLKELSGENIIALCDVDERYAAHTFKEFPNARRYRDFRVMLEKEKSIDAVVIATPDHLHAVATMTALKLGKHVYCEKPLTHTVHEARAITLAAREAKVATQMGNQGMAFEGNRLINEWIWDGAIGPVHEVHAWSDRPTHRGKMPLWWAQGVEHPKDTPPVPDTLDWDLWLGPAPNRPYNPAYVPFRWRGWWDFGSGGLGDMGIHNLAPVFSALKLGAPESVIASSTPLCGDSIPSAAVVHYRFPARGELPPVELHWYDGGLLPDRPDELDDNHELDPEDGILFVGSKGKMLVSGWGGQEVRIIPRSLDKAYQRPPKTLPRSIGHHQEWLAACRGEMTTRSNFDFAGPLTEAVLLGSVCIRNGGEKLIWDSANLRFTNNNEANRFLHYDYRPGWTL